MLFNDARSRTQFFSHYQARPELLEYGSAMKHAGSARLGLVGNRHGLKKDVASVLAIEINRYRSEIGFHAPVTDDKVFSSKSFGRAFDIARIPAENEAEELSAEMISGYEPYIRQVKPVPKDLHAVVSHEIAATPEEDDDE